MGTDKRSRRKGSWNKPLTSCEIKFLRAMIRDGKTQTEAAIVAGYSPSHNSGHQAMNQIRQKAPDLLQEIGLYPKKVMEEILIPGLHAEKVEHFAHQGVVIDSRTVVDHEQRGKYLDRYCKLLGLYANGHDEDGPPRPTATIVINLGFLGQETAEQVLERARQRIGFGDRGQSDVDAPVDENAG
jgi:hypothetical protein